MVRRNQKALWDPALCSGLIPDISVKMLVFVCSFVLLLLLVLVGQLAVWGFLFGLGWFCTQGLIG